jgi:hypothetical protein
MGVRALTVKQPWAWACFHGKNVENRKTRTNHRGLLAIHAGLAWSSRGGTDPRVLKVHVPFQNPLQTSQGRIDHAEHLGCCFAFGAVIGTVDVVGCHPAEPECCSPWGEPGGYHWMLANPQELWTPVPCRGRLGVFDLPDPVAAAVSSPF